MESPSSSHSNAETPSANASSNSNDAPSGALPTNETLTLTSDLHSILNYLKLSLPFLAILLLRFLCSYLIKIIFLIFLYSFYYYFLSELNHQISLKNLLNRQRIYLLFCLSIIFFFLALRLSSAIFHEELWERYLILSYENSGIDFISVLWLCCVTDLSICSLMTTLKLGIALVLVPNSLESRNHPSSFPPLFTSNSGPSMLFQSGLSRCLSIITFFTVLRSFPLRNSTNRARDNSMERDLEIGRILTDASSSQETASTGTGVFRSFLISYGTPRRRSSSSPTPYPNPHTDHPSSHEPAFQTSDDSPAMRNTEAYSYLRMKRIFSNIDLVFAVYRSLLPIPVWGCYFSNGPGADMIPVSYFCIKVINISYLVRAIVEAVGNSIAGRTVSHTKILLFIQVSLHPSLFSGIRSIFKSNRSPTNGFRCLYHLFREVSPPCDLTVSSCIL